MRTRLATVIAVALLALAGDGRAAPQGYRLVDATAATVNGEIIFLSDVSREACHYRCGAVPGQPAGEIPFSEARRRLVADVLVLQEQKKLGTGSPDNAAVAAMAADISSMMKKCPSPCAASVSVEEARDLAFRRLTVREFLDKSVAVFIDVRDEDVRKELEHRRRDGAPESELSEEKIRKEMFAEEAASDIRNWFARVTSKSRIVLSPMQEQ